MCSETSDPEVVLTVEAPSEAECNRSWEEELLLITNRIRIKDSTRCKINLIRHATNSLVRCMVSSIISTINKGLP